MSTFRICFWLASKINCHDLTFLLYPVKNCALQYICKGYAWLKITNHTINVLNLARVSNRNYRSTHGRSGFPEVICKILGKFTGKQLAKVTFLIKLHAKGSTVNFAERLRIHFFIENLRWGASAPGRKGVNLIYIRRSGDARTFSECLL